MAFAPHVSATVVGSAVEIDPLLPTNNVVLYAVHCACIGANKALMWWQVARRYARARVRACHVASHRALPTPRAQIP